MILERPFSPVFLFRQSGYDKAKWGGGEGGTCPKFGWRGAAQVLLEILTPFQAKICDFPNHI